MSDLIAEVYRFFKLQVASGKRPSFDASLPETPPDVYSAALYALIKVEVQLRILMPPISRPKHSFRDTYGR